MPRLIAPNDTMREVEITGARFGRSKTYRWSKDGTVHVDTPSDIKALKDAGFTVAGTANPSGGRGYTCKKCSFRGFFKTCGKCGSEAERE